MLKEKRVQATGHQLTLLLIILCLQAALAVVLGIHKQLLMSLMVLVVAVLVGFVQPLRLLGEAVALKLL
jgi:hypothetical protein